MKRVVWSKTARRELEQINGWFEQFGPDVPLIMTLRVEEALNKLLDFPRIGSPMPDGDFRKFVVRKTPYLIFYKPIRNGVRVLKVRHARSNWRAES